MLHCHNGRSKSPQHNQYIQGKLAHCMLGTPKTKENRDMQTQFFGSPSYSGSFDYYAQHSLTDRAVEQAVSAESSLKPWVSSSQVPRASLAFRSSKWVGEPDKVSSPEATRNKKQAFKPQSYANSKLCERECAKQVQKKWFCINLDLTLIPQPGSVRYSLFLQPTCFLKSSQGKSGGDPVQWHTPPLLCICKF